MKVIARSLLKIPPDRQRGSPDPEKIAALSNSIVEFGLLHPPVVQPGPDGTYTLLAGETRLRAIDQIWAEGGSFRYGSLFFDLGEHLPVNLISELSPLEAFQVELEENVRRTALPWQKETEAYAKLHKLKLEAGLVGVEALKATEEVMSNLTQTSPKSVGETHQAILLGAHMDDPDVAKAKTRSDALKIVAKKLRKEADLAAAPPPPASVVLGNCIEVLAGLPDAHFDGIVSDPPYGIGITQMSYQQSSEQEYDDSYETWGPLMNDLADALKRVLKPDCFGFLFCDWSRFELLKAIIEVRGFEVYSRPMIWDRTPDGRLTTPEKWPRRCYECILYFRRGNHQLLEYRSDVLTFPADRDSSNYHGAKKPVALYAELLSRAARPGSRVLDPFAGSGPLLRAAKLRSLDPFCIEKDETYFSLMLRLQETTQ